MTRFKIIVDKNQFEVENNYDCKRNVTQFDIYFAAIKVFSIEPGTLCGRGDDKLWQLTEEYKGFSFDKNTIIKLGKAIEKLIN